MQYPSSETPGIFPNPEMGLRDESHDTRTTREHGWVDDDEDLGAPPEGKEAPTEHERRGGGTRRADDQVRRLDDGHLVWEPHASYSLYETEDPFTYGAERGYALHSLRDRAPARSRSSTRNRC